MITVLLQTGLCLLAGFALWKMWRSAEGDERLVRYIVFVGFTARALAGTILFWISWLGLPIFSRLQMGNGHWFFATDGRRYLREAISIAQGGLPTIVMHHRTGASVSYVQTLAVSTMLFGDSAAIGVLVNLFSYMGMCLIILKWCRAIPAARTPGLIALAAISLSPSAVLWSTQPLKDTLFQFLIVSLIAAGALWQRSWREGPSTRAIVAAALVMIAALFMASGIRWYFGFIALAASGAFFLLTAATAQRRWRALFAGAVTFFVLTQSLVISASAYLPPYLQKVLEPWKESTVGTLDTLSPDRLAQDLKNARSGFENSGGATSIGVAGALAQVDSGRRFAPAAAPVTDDDFAKLAAKQAESAEKPDVMTRGAEPSRRRVSTEPPKTAAHETSAVAVASAERPAATAEQPAPIVTMAAEPPANDLGEEAEGSAFPPMRSLRSILAGTPQPSSSPTPVSGMADTPPAEAGETSEAVVTAPTKRGDPEPREAGVEHATKTVDRNTSAEVATAAAKPEAGKTNAAVVADAKGPARPAPRIVNSKRLPPSEAVAAQPTRKQPARPQPATPHPATPQPPTLQPATPRPPVGVVAEGPVPPPSVPPVPAEESSESSGLGDGEIIMPTSTVGRLLAGTVAVLLPSRVARDMGLLEMGGGRGFWWFTDVDSIVFDAMLGIAIVFIVRRVRWATLGNPVLWFVVLVTTVGVPIAYTITNYGTLFRLRAMLFVLLALVPLAVSMGTPKDARDRLPDSEPPIPDA